MKIMSLTIKSGFLNAKFDFPSNVNIVHSEKNSVGKTTLLRFLMYSLGYPIPNTRGINFNNYELDLELLTETGDACHIQRDKDYILFQRGETQSSYSLPFDLNELHTQVFDIRNNDVLDNLLGACYIDQEKGWTLLNRGKAIGNVHFSIEGLIRGLSERSNDDLSIRLATIKRELQKYKHMFDVAQYQTEINARGETIAFDAPTDVIEKDLYTLHSERKPLYDELERLKNVIRKNNSFKNYISYMQIRVISASGEEIPVNEDTIVGFKDDVEYLTAKRKLLAEELTRLDGKINNLKKSLEKENSLFNVQTSIQAFDADISKMKIDIIAVDRIIKRLERERKTVEESINRNIKNNNPIVSELHALISSYSQELGIDEKYVRPNTDFIFTSDLKSLTGAIFHKIVFAFKIAYIKLIFLHTDVKLPIVLDSPSGRELDKPNIAEMMDILARDFSEHQIIIASIYTYNFPNAHVIKIKDRLLPF